jgi:hypothetical protein
MPDILNSIMTQRSAILAASIIGLACWVAAVIDVRSQQESERPGLKPIIGDQSAAPEIHHMRGWLPHHAREAGRAQRV